MTGPCYVSASATASIAVAISFGVGVVMSVTGGREIGEEGNLLLAHGLGVHGIQTLPLIALIVSASRADTTAPMGARRRCRLARRVRRRTAPSGSRATAARISALSAAIIAGLVGWAATAAYAVATRGVVAAA